MFEFWKPSTYWQWNLHTSMQISGLTAGGSTVARRGPSCTRPVNWTSKYEVIFINQQSSLYIGFRCWSRNLEGGPKFFSLIKWWPPLSLALDQPLQCKHVIQELVWQRTWYHVIHAWQKLIFYWLWGGNESGGSISLDARQQNKQVWTSWTEHCRHPSNCL